MASLLLYNQQQASISKSCNLHLNTTIDYNENPYTSNSSTTKFNQPPIIGIISGNSHLIAKALASCTSSLRYAHIDYHSFDSIFSDRHHFSYYYRLSSLANNQAQSIFNLFESSLESDASSSCRRCRNYPFSAANDQVTASL